MRAALLIATLSSPVGAGTAANAHTKAVTVYEEAAKVTEDGRTLLKELAAMRARYAADMDVEAVGAQRAALLTRVADMQRRYGVQRRELLELRKENQRGQLVRLLEGVPKEQFATGLLEALDFRRFFAEFDGFNRRVDSAIKDDAAAFAAARTEADQRRMLLLFLLVVGAVALLVVVLLAALPRRTAVRRLE